MDERIFNIRISPENISNKIFPAVWYGGTIIPDVIDDECCDLTTTTTTQRISGITYVYSSMTEILSGGTNGTSILTGLTIPIFLTENTVDIGYYTIFDGIINQQDTMANFIFSSSTDTPNTYYFYNTSDREFKKYLEFSNYKVDWGDGTPGQVVNSTIVGYSHTYGATGKYTITLSGMSPWGINLIKKDIYVPYSSVTIDNEYGTAYFYPSGGNWSGTPISYDYLFSGDSVCDEDSQISSNYTTVPFLITGYTKSTLNDLEQYGTPKFKIGIQVTGTSNVVGTYYGADPSGLYTAYTVNGVDYYDFFDGTTIFATYSSGIIPDMLVCSGITKNEALLNVISPPEIYSGVFIERGKRSALESFQRLGEVDNVGDLVKYGYKFFNII
jgi:hypothetical protein